MSDRAHRLLAVVQGVPYVRASQQAVYPVRKGGNMVKGIVAAGHPVTAEAAAEILSDGGNAFDAVIAGLLACLTPETVLASLGGGGYLMAHESAAERTTLYDFFVDTPRRKRPVEEIDFKAVHVDFGPATQEFHVGAGATANPGFVPGIFAVHVDLCSLPMTRIVEPAVRAARDGVMVTAFQAYLFSIIAPILTREVASTALHAPEGHVLTTGECFRNPALADTLEQLAHDGADLFIHGDIGQAILQQSAESGGHLLLEDLEGYRVEKRRPLRWSHQDHDVFLNPAPAAGGPLIAFGLGLLERLDATHQRGIAASGGPSLVDLARVMTETNEARRLKGEGLTNLADRDVIAAHFEELAGRANANRGTTHVSVIDTHGNAAAATVSNGEGNGHMVGSHGFMLNNMLGEEDLNPDGFGAWLPGQRLSSMMSPTLIQAPDRTLTALGSGGSNRIRTAVLQVVCNLIDRGMTLEEAVNAPRIHVEKCGTVSYEDQIGSDARAELRAAFPDAHGWPERNMFFGGVHAVRRQPDGRWEGTGDTRRGGVSVIVE
jgi:gamma-glutamyltranspeptidase/glutathione hydrolase